MEKKGLRGASPGPPSCSCWRRAVRGAGCYCVCACVSAQCALLTFLCELRIAQRPFISTSVLIADPTLCFAHCVLLFLLFVTSNLTLYLRTISSTCVAVHLVDDKYYKIVRQNNHAQPIEMMIDASTPILWSNGSVPDPLDQRILTDVVRHLMRTSLFGRRPRRPYANGWGGDRWRIRRRWTSNTSYFLSATKAMITVETLEIFKYWRDAVNPTLQTTTQPQAPMLLVKLF